MKKYKITSSTKPEFEGIEIPLDIDNYIVGSNIVVLGHTFTITQSGSIIVLVNEQWCLTLIDITPKVKSEVSKLIINDTLEIYLETKEIEVKCKATFKELYNILLKEWNFINTLDNEPFPCEYNEELKLLTFVNDWKLTDASVLNMEDGSFSCKNKAGRYI